MELQVPYGICAEVQKEGILLGEKSGDTRDIEDAVSIERSGNNRR